MARIDVYELKKVVWAMGDGAFGAEKLRRIWVLIQDVFGEETLAGDQEADPYECEWMCVKHFIIRVQHIIDCAV
jgi:hypothetical protein